MSNRQPHRDAIRVLFIIRAGGSTPDTPSDGIVSILRSELRLHAMDFWVRNPDYLADELLDIYQQTGDRNLLAAADSIFAYEEPDLRRIPMIRYLFGAFDRLDDTLSLLRSRELIQVVGIKKGLKVQETDFLLTVKGEKFCVDCLTIAPLLRWYSDRANLVASIAVGRSGTALKDKQYERTSYAETATGGIIPSIASEVIVRLEQLKMSGEGVAG